MVSNRDSSAYQPNALPLGHTGSQLRPVLLKAFVRVGKSVISFNTTVLIFTASHCSLIKVQDIFTINM